MIHSMLRVADEERSLAFYRAAFGAEPVGRFPFDTFTIVYLQSPESDFELELTINHDRAQPYSLGDGYGHLAVAVDDLEAEHRRVGELGLEPGPLKELTHGGRSLARFFFLTDPDGYKLEVLQSGGRYV